MKVLTIVYLSITTALIFILPVFAIDIQDGLVSYWNFDEAKDDTVNDLVGNNDCTISGTPTWIKGKFDGGLELNGIGNFLDCGDDKSLDITDTLTIAAWVKIAAFGNWDGIVTKGINSGPYAMQLWGNGALRFSPNWGNPAGFKGAGSFNTNTKMKAGEWTHAAITYDGTQAHFYINGEQDKLEVKQDFTFGVVKESLILGCDFPGGDEYFDGVMDEFFIYSRALTEAEISQVMDGGEGVLSVNQTGKLGVAWGMIKNFVR